MAQQGRGVVPDERRNWFDDDAETIMHWREKPTGQHMELGIAETNLVGLMGELGATWSRWGQPLFPIGVMYDPFVERALEPWSYGIYAGGQSILVGTPSGRDPGRRRWCPPVDQDAVDRTRTARLRQLRAGVRDRRGVDAVGLHRPPGPPRRQLVVSAAVDPSGRQAWPRCPPIPPPGNVAAGRWWPVRTRCGMRRSPRCRMVAMGAIVTETLTAADRLAGRASPPKSCA